MPQVRHKKHYISVVHLPDKSGESSCICCVEIRHEREEALSTRLILDQRFDTVQDATERGFAAGKQWIDQRSAAKKSASEPGEGSAFLRLRRLPGASVLSRS